MFYPDFSLRKGGRFHLCLVADSWPSGFASITLRELWSEDLRTNCDDLKELMTNDSGRPSRQFSLRLCSQLVRGLIRLYQKKADCVIVELHLLNASIMKSSSKKFKLHHAAEEVERQMVPMLELQAPVEEPIPEPEETFEEMILQCGNMVANIEDITLKEADIPDFQFPPDDGFGEEDPEQEWELLRDLTLEQMLSPSGPHSLMHSALDASASAPALAQDAELVPGLELHNTMERMAECDVTLFRISTAQDLLREESDKEIPIPEIPPPDLPIPNEKEKPLPEPEEPAEVPAAAKAVRQEPEILTLETLEEGEPQAKRRRKNKLIIDKNHQLSEKFFCARIENINVDLRCKFSEDITELRAPAELLLCRAAHAGSRFPGGLARPLARLFSRNLGLAAAAHVDQRELELAVASRARRASVPILETVPEEPAQVPEPQLQELEPQVAEPQPMEEQTILNQSTAVPDLSAVDVEQDIADLPTQKLTTQKRYLLETQDTVENKKPRCGYRTVRESQSQNFVPPEPEIVDKENVSDNWQTIPARTEEQPIIPNIEIQRASDPERVLKSMLQEAGLVDLQMTRPEQPPVEVEVEQPPQICDQWGTEGTMVKIIKMVKAETRPLNMDSLMSFGPMVPGSKRINAARCFDSLMKLKQHGFIKLRKDPRTLEILDISLGPKFDTC